MKLSQQSLLSIESTIQKAVGRYIRGCEQATVTDIHMQPDQISGLLVIYNDDDEELGSVMVKEWATYEGDDFMEKAESALRNILDKMEDGGTLKKS